MCLLTRIAGSEAMQELGAARDAFSVTASVVEIYCERIRYAAAAPASTAECKSFVVTASPFEKVFESLNLLVVAFALCLDDCSPRVLGTLPEQPADLALPP